MRAMFMASGPAFKKNFFALPFDNIDVYPLVSRVLNLRDPPANVRPNGTMVGVQQLLSTGGKSVAGRLGGGGTMLAAAVALLPAAVGALRHV